MICGFIAEHKARFGVAPICRALAGHGCQFEVASIVARFCSRIASALGARM